MPISRKNSAQQQHDLAEAKPSCPQVMLRPVLSESMGEKLLRQIDHRQHALKDRDGHEVHAA